MTPEQRLERARDMIRVKRYDDARKLLERIDDPRAAVMLAEIEGKHSSPPAKPRFSPQTRRLMMIAAVLVVTGIISFGIFKLIETASKGSARSEMFSWCLDENTFFSCRDWVTLEETDHLDDITTCYEQFKENNASFRQCLVDKGIQPPSQ